MKMPRLLSLALALVMLVALLSGLLGGRRGGDAGRYRSGSRLDMGFMVRSRRLAWFE